MRERDAAGLALVVAALCLPLPALPRAAAPTVTITEGPATIHTSTGGYLPAAGVRLNACDILSTGPQAMVQVEYPDGARIQIGPDSRFVFDLPQGGEAIGPHFLLAGWAKITVPKREKAPPYRIDMPHLGVVTEAGVTVLRVAGDESEFFVEQGSATALTPTPVGVAAGSTYARKAGAEGAVSSGVERTFVEGMPRAFRDTLPTRLGRLESADVQPQPVTNYRPADAKEWLASAPELGSCRADTTVRGAQIALQRGGIDVGPIDGILGPRTEAALRTFQQREGLARTGRLDTETLKALDLAGKRE